jgi:hypothetical protein
MDLILKRSGGANVVLRPQARATYYPDAQVDPVEVEIFKQELDADGSFIGAPVSLGRFPSSGRFNIPNTPDTDKNVRIYAVAYAPDGTPDVSSLADAVQATVLVKRETEAPVIGQDGAATSDTVKIGISGFTRFARQRRVRIADNPEMTNPIEIVLDSDDYVARELPKYFILERELAVESNALLLESGSYLLLENGLKLLLES